MSLFRAKIIYTDEKEVLVDFSEQDMEEFSKNISNQEIYWNETKDHGFWTNISKIRYITFIKVNENTSDDTQSQSVSTDSGEVSSEDERPSDIEDALNT